LTQNPNPHLFCVGLACVNKTFMGDWKND
jgi:hypothetical protein